MSDDSSLSYEPDVQRVFNSKESTKAYYDKIARVYDLMAEQAEEPMREAGLKKLAAAPGETMLEIGFGTGHCLVELAKAVGPEGKVYGIDLSEKMKELAAELLQKEGLADRAQLRCGDATQLPFDAQSCDGVFMSFTLELFDTPEIPQVLAQCWRVLKPGGRIVVVAVSKDGPHGVVFNIYEWSHKHFPNLVDCRAIYVQRALEAAGFQTQDASVESMWVPVEIVLATKPKL